MPQPRRRAARRTDRGARPAQAPDVGGADPGGSADGRLQLGRATPGDRIVGRAPAVRVAAPPAREAGLHGLEALAGALVRIGDEKHLERSPRQPAVRAVVEEARHGMPGDGLRELGVPARGKPRGGPVAVRKGRGRIGPRDRLVDVVEERGRLDERPVRAAAAGRAAPGEPARDLGHGACVAKVPGRRIEGEQEGGCGRAGWNGHLVDHTRGRPASPIAGAPPAPAPAGRASPAPASALRAVLTSIPATPSATSIVPTRSVRRTLTPVAASAIEHLLRRVAVVVPGPDGDRRDQGARRRDQGAARGRTAPVVARLEQVDRCEAPGDQSLLDVRLGVAGQQEPPTLEGSQQHDRRVVHGPAVVGGLASGRGRRPARGRPGRSRRARTCRPRRACSTAPHALSCRPRSAS